MQTIAKQDVDIKKEIAGLYIATFNRVPDKAGMGYWTNRYKEGMKIEEIAKSFFDQPETKLLYGDNDLDKFINSVYENVLDRKADDSEFDYWKSELSNGNISKDKFIIAILNAAKEHSDDNKHLIDKTELGLKYIDLGFNDDKLGKVVIQEFKETKDKKAVEQSLEELVKNHKNAIEDNKVDEDYISEFKKLVIDIHGDKDNDITTKSEAIGHLGGFAVSGRLSSIIDKDSDTENSSNDQQPIDNTSLSKDDNNTKSQLTGDTEYGRSVYVDPDLIDKEDNQDSSLNNIDTTKLEVTNPGSGSRDQDKYVWRVRHFSLERDDKETDSNELHTLDDDIEDNNISLVGIGDFDSDIIHLI